MTTSPSAGFNDPTAQRLERITTGADPDVVGPLLADVLHDPRWLTCDVALISGGKSNLTYRVACDAGEVILRRPPLGQHPSHRARHGARAPRPERARGDGGPVPRTLHIGDADSSLGAPFYVMERVLGHICRNALPPHYADTPAQRAAIGESPRRRARRAAHGRPRRGRTRRVRPARRLHGAPAAPLVRAVGGVLHRPDARSRRAARRACAHAARRSGVDDRPRRLPARQHHPAPDRPRPHRRRPRLGDEHARRSVHGPRCPAGVLGRAGGRGRAQRRADRRTRDRRRGLPVARRGHRALRAPARASMSPTRTGTGRSRTSSSRSSARASPPGRPAARWSGRASTMRRGWWHRSSKPDGTRCTSTRAPAERVARAAGERPGGGTGSSAAPDSGGDRLLAVAPGLAPGDRHVMDLVGTVGDLQDARDCVQLGAAACPATTPTPPWAWIARSITQVATSGAATLIAETSMRAPRLPTVSISHAVFSTSRRHLLDLHARLGDPALHDAVVDDRPAERRPRGASARTSSPARARPCRSRASRDGSGRGRGAPGRCRKPSPSSPSRFDAGHAHVVVDDLGVAAVRTVVVAEQARRALDLHARRVPRHEDHALAPVRARRRGR